MTNSSVPPEAAAVAVEPRATWAPWWVLACIALWPWVGPANVAVSLGAIVTVGWLGVRRFRGGDALLSREAWALTSVLFFSYWLPELLSCADAIHPATSFKEVATDLRFLPFLWLVAIAVHRERDRNIVWTGIAIIAALWTVDGIVQALTGYSLGGVEPRDRISGVFGRHERLGQVLASLAAFPLGFAARRAGVAGWITASIVLGVTILLAGSRASWLSYALVLLFGGWRLLGWKRMFGLFAAGALSFVVLALVFPRELQERIERTETVFAGNARSIDAATSGRLRIWEAAICMGEHHPVNGVGVRGYRYAYDACAPKDLGPAPWGEGGALHAHQLVLEVFSETGLIGIVLWLIGTAIALKAWRVATSAARARAFMPAIALAVTVFPLNTHLAFYSSFWGGVTLLLAGLYAGAMFGIESGEVKMGSE